MERLFGCEWGLAHHPFEHGMAVRKRGRRARRGERSGDLPVLGRFRRPIEPEAPQFATQRVLDPGVIQTGLNLNVPCHRFIWLA